MSLLRVARGRGRRTRRDCRRNTGNLL